MGLRVCNAHQAPRWVIIVKVSLYDTSGEGVPVLSGQVVGRSRELDSGLQDVNVQCVPNSTVKVFLMTNLCPYLPKPMPYDPKGPDPRFRVK